MLVHLSVSITYIIFKQIDVNDFALQSIFLGMPKVGRPTKLGDSHGVGTCSNFAKNTAEY